MPMADGLMRDLQVNVGRQSPLRPPVGSCKSTLSGRSTPRNSPTYRRSNSSRTPRREGRISGTAVQWLRSSRLVYLLLLITLWAYLGFYVQSRWVHGDNKEEFLGFRGNHGSRDPDKEQNQEREMVSTVSHLVVNNEPVKVQVEDAKRIDVALNKKVKEVSTRSIGASKKKSKRASRGKHGKARDKPKAEVETATDGVEEPDIPKKNTTYGLLLGPFGAVEDRSLEWSPEKRRGTCDRKGEFARLVWSRHFVLIFHELSMTGAPLSMLELATEFLSCGATVSAVVLSKKGGLMQELTRRRIKVVEDRTELSFKTAMKADLVIAGSAVCASWIDQYITHFQPGGSQIVWWIMENRQEYFDRAKIVLDRVRVVIFLSELQTQQWLSWCEKENIKLRSPPAVVQLSVNDELAFVAGIACSLNTPSSSPEKMLEKRKLLRDSVRNEMGLADNDVLVMSLSSINPGKGQLLLVESLHRMLEQGSSQKIKTSVNVDQEQANLAAKHHLRSLLHDTNNLDRFANVKAYRAMILDRSSSRRKILSKSEQEDQVLRLLIGSVGSKSNKVPYVKEILNFTSQHSNLSSLVLWTPATTRVASLYSAADVYVINAQGLGETFGRVTIEAMAFGLPVLGTDAGGTKEIVEHNVTGLLHPTGRPGTRILAQNLHLMLKNPSLREQMGKEGRKKAKKMYLKRHMYKKLGEVLYRSMRVK